MRGFGARRCRLWLHPDPGQLRGSAGTTKPGTFQSLKVSGLHLFHPARPSTLGQDLPARHTMGGGCNPGAAQTGDRASDTGSFRRLRPYQTSRQQSPQTRPPPAGRISDASTSDLGCQPGIRQIESFYRIGSPASGTSPSPILRFSAASHPAADSPDPLHPGFGASIASPSQHHVLMAQGGAKASDAVGRP